MLPSVISVFGGLGYLETCHFFSPARRLDGGGGIWKDDLKRSNS